MKPNYLENLQAGVESLLRQESFARAVDALRAELAGSPEPFVWSPVALESIGVELPEQIRSCWIFLLRRDAPSGCHYHPNSIQHMIALNGAGLARVGGVESAIIPIGSSHHSTEEKWYVIEEGVPHEFFPAGEDMAVVSFHTCEADELEEIDCGSGASRLYEPPEPSAAP